MFSDNLFDALYCWRFNFLLINLIPILFDKSDANFSSLSDSFSLKLWLKCADIISRLYFDLIFPNAKINAVESTPPESAKTNVEPSLISVFFKFN